MTSCQSNGLIPVYYNLGLIFVVLVIILIINNNIVKLVAGIWEYSDIAIRRGKKDKRSNNQTGKQH